MSNANMKKKTFNKAEFTTIDLKNKIKFCTPGWSLFRINKTKYS